MYSQNSLFFSVNGTGFHIKFRFFSFETYVVEILIPLVYLAP